MAQIPTDKDINWLFSETIKFKAEAEARKRKKTVIPFPPKLQLSALDIILLKAGATGQKPLSPFLKELYDLAQPRLRKLAEAQARYLKQYLKQRRKQ